MVSITLPTAAVTEIASSATFNRSCANPSYRKAIAGFRATIPKNSNNTQKIGRASTKPPK